MFWLWLRFHWILFYNKSRKNCLYSFSHHVPICFENLHRPCVSYAHYIGNTWSHLIYHLHALRWRHNERDGVSNHQPRDCLLNRLFRRRSKKTSKLRVTGLGEGNSPVTDEFPAQMASYAENVSIWWRHHGNTWAEKRWQWWMYYCLEKEYIDFNVYQQIQCIPDISGFLCAVCFYVRIKCVPDDLQAFYV